MLWGVNVGVGVAVPLGPCFLFFLGKCRVFLSTSPSLDFIAAPEIVQSIWKGAASLSSPYLNTSLFKSIIHHLHLHSHSHHRHTVFSHLMPLGRCFRLATARVDRLAFARCLTGRCLVYAFFCFHDWATSVFRLGDCCMQSFSIMRRV